MYTNVRNQDLYIDTLIDTVANYSDLFLRARRLKPPFHCNPAVPTTIPDFKNCQVGRERLLVVCWSGAAYVGPKSIGNRAGAL